MTGHATERGCEWVRSKGPPLPAASQTTASQSSSNVGGVVFALSKDGGRIMTVSFESCTVTGNIAVSMRQLIMRRCMRACGSVQITAVSASCLEREVLGWV